MIVLIKIIGGDKTETPGFIIVDMKIFRSIEYEGICEGKSAGPIPEKKGETSYYLEEISNNKGYEIKKSVTLFFDKTVGNINEIGVIKFGGDEEIFDLMRYELIKENDELKFELK